LKKGKREERREGAETKKFRRTKFRQALLVNARRNWD
jgi:hypothetical protein